MPSGEAREDQRACQGGRYAGIISGPERHREQRERQQETTKTKRVIQTNLQRGAAALTQKERRVPYAQLPKPLLYTFSKYFPVAAG